MNRTEIVKIKGDAWRKIKGFPRYSASRNAEIRNDETGQILKPKKGKNGYLYVNLYPGCKRVSIHRAVAVAFIPNPENKPEVNHKNGDKLQCSDWNLEWATRSENILHRCRKLGILPSKAKMDALNRAAAKVNKKSVLCTETDVVYESAREAFRHTGVYYGNISKCARGMAKTAGGYHWRFALETEVHT